jgi:hypothetical protein
MVYNIIFSRSLSDVLFMILFLTFSNNVLTLRHECRVNVSCGFLRSPDVCH